MTSQSPYMKRKFHNDIVGRQIICPQKAFTPQSNIGIKETIQRKEDRDLQQCRNTPPNGFTPASLNNFICSIPNLLLIIPKPFLHAFDLGL